MTVIKLEDGADLNTLETPGMYAVHNPTNGPATADYFVEVISANINGVSRAKQIATNAVTGEAHTRVRAGAWISWVAVGAGGGGGGGGGGAQEMFQGISFVMLADPNLTEQPLTGWDLGIAFNDFGAPAEAVGGKFTIQEPGTYFVHFLHGARDICDGWVRAVIGASTQDFCYTAPHNELDPQKIGQGMNYLTVGDLTGGATLTPYFTGDDGTFGIAQLTVTKVR